MGLLADDPLFPADPLWTRERAWALLAAVVDVILGLLVNRGSRVVYHVVYVALAFFAACFPDAMGYVSYGRATNRGRQAPLDAEVYVKAIGWIALAGLFVLCVIRLAVVIGIV